MWPDMATAQVQGYADPKYNEEGKNQELAHDRTLSPVLPPFNPGSGSNCNSAQCGALVQFDL